MKNTLLLSVFALTCFACQKNIHDLSDAQCNAALKSVLNLPETPASYERDLPGYLKLVGLHVLPVSDQKATLGRVLFYDTNLSQDRSIACASCHKQSNAFSDTEAFSKGVNGQQSARNSMPLANVVSFSAHYSPLQNSAPRLLWDNRAASVEEQSVQAFFNKREMGLTVDQVVDRVKEQTYYEALWRQTYGNFDVDPAQIKECLAEFVGAMGGANSKFDQAMNQASGAGNAIQSAGSVHNAYYPVSTIANLPGLGLSGNRGRVLFVNNCSVCHSPIESFQDITEACNGLDLDYVDQGRFGISGVNMDKGVFKSPSLRNIALTAPYMHDGRFKSLEEVVDFYSTKVKNHPNLHPAMLKNGNIFRNFTAQDQSDLVAFLNMLTDNSIATDERFSDPFWH